MLPESTPVAYIANAIVLSPALEPTVKCIEPAEHLASTPVGGQRSRDDDPGLGPLLNGVYK